MARASASCDPRACTALALGAQKLASASDTPRLDAELLLAHATGRTRGAVLALADGDIDPSAAARFAALVERRGRGEPLAYLTGEREFYSLPLVVTPAVLIPRPETEGLVEHVIEAASKVERPSVLDLGTGSGAIALAVKHALPAARVTATDVSAAALAVARRNAADLRLDVRFIESRWFEGLGEDVFDVIASNPPYVCTADVRGALEREPRLALDGGSDGFDSFRALLETAPGHLAPNGVLMLEHGYDQRPELTRLAGATGWQVAAAYDDLAGLPRVLVLGWSGK